MIRALEKHAGFAVFRLE